MINHFGRGEIFGHEAHTWNGIHLEYC